MKTILTITDLHVGAQIEQNRGVFESAVEYGWRVVEIERARLKCDLRDVISRWHPDGGIMDCGSYTGSWKELHQIFGSIPLVCLDPSEEVAKKASLVVEIDAAKIVGLARQEFARCHAVSFGYVGWHTDTGWCRARRESFVDAVKRAYNLPVHVYSECWDLGDIFAFNEKLKKFLRDLPKPAAVLVVNDYVAAQVLDVARSMKLACPGDLFVCGVDNDEMICEHTLPTLSSVAIDFAEEGRVAAQILNEFMRTGQTQKIASGAPHLVRRHSTCHLKTHDALMLKAMEIISRDACSGITAAEVLSQLPLSRRMAERRFYAATGKTILEMIHDIRFEKVCDYLRSDLPIGHIATRCGMQSDSFLARFFKARTGLSLREWRKRHVHDDAKGHLFLAQEGL